MFRKTLSAFGLIAAMATPAQAADDTKLETLDTWGKNRGWEAVGLLHIDGNGRCTGTLIAPNLVLTAAHCLVDPASGEKVDPRKIEFRAGWRDGAAVATRWGSFAVVDENYRDGDESKGNDIAHDLALLQLEAPILATHANPFRVGRTVQMNTSVRVVSYGRGRFDAPSQQRTCSVFERWRSVQAYTCDAVKGSSGSPIFAMRDGRPEIVSVVSSIGPYKGQQVTYGMVIDAKVDTLKKNLRSGNGVYPTKNVSARRVVVGGTRAAGGAKFLRP